MQKWLGQTEEKVEKRKRIKCINKKKWTKGFLKMLYKDPFAEWIHRPTNIYLKDCFMKSKSGGSEQNGRGVGRGEQRWKARTSTQTDHSYLYSHSPEKLSVSLTVPWRTHKQGINVDDLQKLSVHNKCKNMPMTRVPGENEGEGLGVQISQLWRNIEPLESWVTKRMGK